MYILSRNKLGIEVQSVGKHEYFKVIMGGW